MKGKSLFIILLMLLGFSLTAMGQITVDGSVAAVNTDYFMVNVESGLYLKFGGANNAKAAEGHAGTIIRLERKDDNNYAIKTNAGYLDNDLMMTGAASEWVFTKVKDKNQYYLKTSNGHGVLSTKNDANGVLRLASYNPDDNKQKWILLTKSDVTEDLFDITPLIRAASFDKNDAISAWGLNADDIIGTIENSDAAEYHLMVTGEKTITQNLGDCPSGTYVLSFDAYYQRTSTSGEVTVPTVSVEVNKKSTSVPINESDTWGKYSLTLQIQSKNGKSIVINIESENNAELHVDNFVLKYIDNKKGDEDEVEQEEQSQFVSRLNTYIEETRAKVDALNEAGRAVYNISGVIADRDAGNIKTEEAFLAAIAAIDAAYEVALAAHNQKELDDLLNGGNNGGDGGDDNEGDDETEEEDKEVDVTDLFIKNAGFGTGDDSYWTINGAVISTSGVNVTGATGSYMFRGRSIAQDVTVTNGKYKLTAKVASTSGATVTLTANKGLLTEQSTSLQTGAAMTEISLDKVIVYNGMLLIQATGDAEFYTDDFTLSFREHLPDDPQLADTEVLDAAIDFYPTITIARTLKANTWNTVVFPFDMDIPEGWEVKTLASSTTNGENITLFFEDVESIEAGVPYMVRTAEVISTITGRNAWLNTELKHTSTDHVTLVGVYEAGNIPEGAFFISANKFWYAQDGTNTIKAYRAYIQPKTSNARAMGYRFDGEEGTTAIDKEQLSNDNEATVVAIYTLGGTRISDLQQGVNILQMSNGTTIKVVIK